MHGSGVPSGLAIGKNDSELGFRTPEPAIASAPSITIDLRHCYEMSDAPAFCG
jgi:hypothetical protein